MFGSTLSVVASKNASVSLPPANSKFDDSAHLTKNFEESKEHRFKKPGSKNEKHICPPANALHLSNLPEGTTEDEVMDLFSNTATNVRFFGDGNKMAFVTFATVQDAVHSLISYHNYNLRGKYIRVTFSHANND